MRAQDGTRVPRVTSNCSGQAVISVAPGCSMVPSGTGKNIPVEKGYTACNLGMLLVKCVENIPYYILCNATLNKQAKTLMLYGQK